MLRYMKYNEVYQQKLDDLSSIIIQWVKCDGNNITTLQQYQKMNAWLVFIFCMMFFWTLYGLFSIISHIYAFIRITDEAWHILFAFGITFLIIWTYLFYKILYKISWVIYFSISELILFSQIQKYFSIRQDLDNLLKTVNRLTQEDRYSQEVSLSINYYISKCCKIINGNYKRITNFNERIQKKIKTLHKQEQSVEQSKKVNNYNEYIQHELWEFTQCSEDIICNLQDWLANHAKELKTLEDTLNENVTILNLTKTRIQLQRTNIEKSLLIGNQ